MFSGVPCQGGDRFTRPAAGGGGFGDPLERSPAAVLEDVVDGYVSVEAAEAVYGVSIRQNHQGRVVLPEDFEIQEEA